jgi:hypothetical protein
MTSDDGFWAELAARLLHPVQLQIVEAMRWIDRPLSVTELFLVFGKEHRLSTIAYHVRRLASLGALRPKGRRSPVRGSIEKLYLLGFGEE